MKCHICDADTEWFCRQCDEPVCEDCCVPFTLQNQIDYTLCTVCHDGYEARRSIEYARQEKEREERERIKNDRLEKRRAAYRKPENVQKRRVARLQRKLEAIALKRKQFAEAVRIVSEMFRGM